MRERNAQVLMNGLARSLTSACISKISAMHHTVMHCQGNKAQSLCRIVQVPLVTLCKLLAICGDDASQHACQERLCMQLKRTPKNAHCQKGNSCRSGHRLCPFRHRMKFRAHACTEMVLPNICAAGFDSILQ